MNGHECEKIDKLNQHDMELEQLNIAVFRGNGEPSLKERMHTMEKMVYGMMWICGTSCAAVLGEIIIEVMRHFAK